MKKFFQNPYYLAWVIALGLILVLGIISSFVNALFRVVIVLIGAECIYSGVLLLLAKRKNKVNVEDFVNESEVEQKKFSFAKSEQKMNSTLLIVSLFIFGVVLIYLAFR